MCFLNFSRQFLSQILQHNIIQGYTGVVRGACLISKARRSTQFLCRGYTCLSSQQSFLHLSTFQNCMGRYFFSELHRKDTISQWNSTEKSRTQQDGYEIESDSSHRKLQEKFNIDVLVSLLRQENAADICVIKVPEDIQYADYFIVVSGSSTRHLRAMALYAIKVYKYMKKDCVPNAKIEGQDAEDWMCIDFGSMVVHFMLPETRGVYELEKPWTLRSFDEKLSNIPVETLPEDFIYAADFNVTK
ncbi:mitochondrial assembly of ribosomal large subunit protein 1 [Esox lucius]|uniref:Mitochondrial assembly of ribosomal large subunit protein 1 n=1 Tax=Esox lucius TaxID=8010 RepID=C1BZI5_ESOLU|nr:mitochondrial assembly of ribosomal large subunit protein 1 [Esox lucius]ACO14438.1 C7orf30 [Esox lucius]